MSEFINNRAQKINQERVNDLLAVSTGIMHGMDARILMEKYRDAIEHITPYDMIALEDLQIRMGITPETIKKDLQKVISLFYKGLSKYRWDKPEEDTFLYYLMLENEAFTFRLNQVKKIVKLYKGRETCDYELLKEELLPRFRDFLEFNYHYIKKENILFPFLEKRWKQSRPLSIMWSLHDDIRRKLKLILHILEDPESTWRELSKEMGLYFFLVFGMIEKENLVLFPVATENLRKDLWDEMLMESFEYPFPFVETPPMPHVIVYQTEAERATIPSTSGELTVEQALLAFNNLPVDITLVDEEDKVRFFNKAADRTFPRSPAIIGRSVQLCHPPESVHVVEKIIRSFRAGKKDTAEFRVHVRGRYILIRYYALRNGQGVYKGVLEVSQDITDIQGLEGEKRLLDWDSDTE